MYKPVGTLRDTIDNIEQKRWVLPAIQREFVWKPEQVCTLFDSLMQGYPFGTFLFWKVEAERSGDWRFYDFVLNYHEKNAPHCPDLGPIHDRALIAVLDGQQRLTALNIGLRGSLALRRKHGRKNDPNAFPRMELFLNLLHQVPDDTETDEVTPLTKEKYQFKFIETAQSNMDTNHLWFKVSDILRLPAGPEMLSWLQEVGVEGEKLTRAFRILDRLHSAVHKDQVVFCYEESGQDIENVLKIFIRLNSQGTPLSQSDLLHSIAVAQWADRDARREISSLTDDLNQAGAWYGAFKQSFVLKAGLMLSDVASVGFKVENFTRKNMTLLERDWDPIRQALILTSRLATNFGLNYYNLRAVSAILPIAYYLFKIDAADSFLTHTKHNADRLQIRLWLMASLLKPSGVWGSGLDTLLTALREVIRDDHESGFPAPKLREVMASRGKTLSFSDAEIERLADSQYNDKNTVLILSVLYPFVDLRNKSHVDHIFPATLLSRAALTKANVTDEGNVWIQFRKDKLANLQLMDGAENNEKRSKLPGAWIDLCYPTEQARQNYRNLNDIGDNPLLDISAFELLFNERRRKLVRRLSDELR